MSNLSLCRTCLAFSIKMHDLRDSKLRDIFEKLTCKTLNTELAGTLICFICHSQLLRSQRFADMVWKSEVLLTELVIKGVEISQDTISRLGITSPYAITPLDYFYNGSREMEIIKEDVSLTEHEVAVKEEKIEIEEVQILAEVKEEIKEEIDYFEEFTEEPAEYWLEEDIDVEEEVIVDSYTIERDIDDKYENKFVDIESVHCKENLPISNMSIKKHTFKCKKCNALLGTKIKLKKHMKIHENNKVYTCDICQKTFKSKTKIIRHIRKHNMTKAKKYICMLCEKIFNKQSYLQNHIRTHTGEKPYICEMCGKTFTDRSTMNRHRKFHKGNANAKTYNCDICNKKFYRNYNLGLHMVTHTGLKPYTCHVCKHSFSQKCSLRGHMRIHTGEKTHYCSECFKGFYRKGHLIQHMSVHTRLRSFTCHRCDRGFSSKRSLAQHNCKSQQGKTNSADTMTINLRPN